MRIERVQLEPEVTDVAERQIVFRTDPRRTGFGEVTIREGGTECEHPPADPGLTL